MSSLPAALLFDCDGTITSPEFLPYIVELTLREIAVKEGLVFDQEVFKRIFDAFKGGGFDKYYAGYFNAMAQGTVADKFGVENFMVRAIDRYVKTLNDIRDGRIECQAFSIRPGVKDVMRRVAALGIPIAVVTNAATPVARANLGAGGIFEVGQAVPAHISDPIIIDLLVDKSHYPDAAKDRKPSGFPYLYACQRLGVHPAGCIGFEDSVNGHQSMVRARVGTRVHTAEEDKASSLFFACDGGEEQPHFSLGWSELTLDVIDGIMEIHGTRLNGFKALNVLASRIAEEVSKPLSEAPRPV